ncbi:PDR/VanB family oxidoreductase [Nocardia rhamnosiphila]|uniref:PDR/VanB family oxidoreductase n=1 Tax=Nocardia rhamnosiphila TaxID=426716 RepID=A0ABV2WYP7_9NOCA
MTIDTALVIVQREEVADGVAAFCLAPPGGGQLPAWSPGAHVDLVLGKGMVRQYSLCGDPADQSLWRVGVLLDPGSRGGSAHIHAHLGVGDQVHVRGPRNRFPLESAQRYVFVAGGIGITPLLPMIKEAERSGAEWVLTYGGRSRLSMAFLEELAPFGDRVKVRPQDEFGLLDLEAALGGSRADTLVYCCGPEPLLQAMTEVCSRWPAGDLHVERFGASPTVSVVDDGAGGAISVELRRTGVTVEVPGDKSILEVVNKAGANVMSSCEYGICGSCETTVLDGIPDHRDDVLTARERESGKSMMLCVSRAWTDHLVLDI